MSCEQDAAGLTQLSSTVEDVFASGDLSRAAETLANMRHCLTAVGEVIFTQLHHNDSFNYIVKELSNSLIYVFQIFRLLSLLI